METLWFFSGTPCFFLVPDSRVLVDEEGNLLPSSVEFIATIHNADEFSKHIERAKILVLVAEDKPFNTDFLTVISQDIPKLVVVGCKSPASVRQQLNALNPDAYLFGVVSSEEFSAALKKAYSEKKAVNAIQEELQKYTDIAFTAMSSASEMGVIALFAERVQTIMDIARLGQLTLSCFRDLNIDGVVQFSFDNNVSIYPADAAGAYKQLISRARAAESRIITYGRFLIFSFVNVQLLIFDTPFEDEERCGRLRDILAHLASITEARLKTLKVNEMLKEQQANSRMVMMLLEMASKDNRNAVKTIMSELSLSLRELAAGLDLTLAQENALMGISEGALESLDSLSATTMAVEDHFRSLLEQLDSAASLLKVDASTEAPINEDAGNKVELF